MLDSLCSHMVCHVFPISTQELPGAGQLETQVAIRLTGFRLAVTIDRFRLEFPLRLPRIHTSNKGREDGGIVVIDQRCVDVGGSLRIGTLHSFPDLGLNFFVVPVLGDQVLKLEPQDEMKC